PADIPQVDSNAASGEPLVRAAGGCFELRGRPAIVTSAMWHRPAAIAAAACPTCTRYDDPPVSVESTTRGCKPRYSVMEMGPKPALESQKYASTSDNASPASASAPSATSPWISNTPRSGMTRSG